MNKEEPDIVFLLMETKVDKKEWIDKVKERCKLKHECSFRAMVIVAAWHYFGKTG